MEGSGRVKAALQGGHLAVATEKEYLIFTGEEQPEKEPRVKSKFGETAAELLAYYKKTYEVTKEDIKKFQKKSLEAQVDYLTKLEEDNQ